jgi:hypothetical protein
MSTVIGAVERGEVKTSERLIPAFSVERTVADLVQYREEYHDTRFRAEDRHHRAAGVGRLAATVAESCRRWRQVSSGETWHLRHTLENERRREYRLAMLAQLEYLQEEGQ